MMFEFSDLQRIRSKSSTCSFSIRQNVAIFIDSLDLTKASISGVWVITAETADKIRVKARWFSYWLWASAGDLHASLSFCKWSPQTTKVKMCSCLCDCITNTCSCCAKTWVTDDTDLARKLRFKYFRCCSCVACGLNTILMCCIGPLVILAIIAAIVYFVFYN